MRTSGAISTSPLNSSVLLQDASIDTQHPMEWPTANTGKSGCCGLQQGKVLKVRARCVKQCGQVWGVGEWGQIPVLQPAAPRGGKFMRYKKVGASVGERGQVGLLRRQALGQVSAWCGGRFCSSWGAHTVTQAFKENVWTQCERVLEGCLPGLTYLSMPTTILPVHHQLTARSHLTTFSTNAVRSSTRLLKSHTYERMPGGPL